MNLLDIYDEITIGAKSTDTFSRELNDIKDKVRDALLQIFKDQDLFYESIKMTSLNGEELLIDTVFLQGSYGTDTAIKRKRKNADADMGIIFNNKVNRQILAKKLMEKFPEYEVLLKKPCITINKGDEYSVDVAIYFKNDNKLYHQHSINTLQIETETPANPHLLLSDCRLSVKEETNPNHRKIIRLAKYFIKNSEDKFEISENNRIPSIALSLFLVDSKNKYHGDLESELQKFLLDLNDYFVKKNYNLQYDKYHIDNVLYKVSDFEGIANLLTIVNYEFKNKNYDKLLTESHFISLSPSEPVKIPGATFGTN